MGKRRAEDDGKPQVHQNIGEVNFSGGRENYGNCVFNNTSGMYQDILMFSRYPTLLTYQLEDTDSLHAKKWLATHASELPPKSKSEDFRFEPRLRDKILTLVDFQSCLSNTGKTFILQGRPGIGKTTTLRGLFKHFRNEAEYDSDVDSNPGEPADEDVDVDSHDSGTESEPRMFGWFSQFLSVFNSQDQSSGDLKPEHDSISAAGKLVTAAIYFSTKRVSTGEHAPTKVLLRLLQQVYKQIPGSIETVKRLHEWSLSNGIPEADSVRRALGTVLKGAERTCIFIDALEECARTHLEDLLFQLGSLQRETRIGIVLTVVLDVNRRLLEQHFQNRTFHQMSANPQDVEAYIRKRLTNISDESFLEKLASGISTAANGM
ncbi:hypothetical protein IG631_14348 [Alternaria alternata]|nr:hypothetical protein IG631_14348 [Alternaria alternata]